MVKPIRMFVDTDLGQMHLRLSTPESVTESPLVCLHMSPQSGRCFESFMSLASDDRCIVAPDYHGCGESDLPPAVPPVTIEDYARTIWQALDQLDIDQIDLLGHHTGSKVATEMAIQRPQSVKNIICISALVLTAAQQKNMSPVFDPIDIDTDGTRFIQMWQALLENRGPGVSLSTVASYFAESLRAGSSYQWAYRAAFYYNHKFAEALSNLTQPVTVFNPGDDLFDHTPNILPYIKKARLIEKKHWGHGFLDANTEEVVKSVKAALVWDESDQATHAAE